MTTLVTGSMGFIGRAYCKAHPDTIGVDIKAAQDVLGYLTGRVFPPCDGIVHLAAISGILDSNQRPVHSLNTNIMGTVAMLEQARLRNKKIVIASSAAVTNPTNPYAAGKLAAEACAIAYSHTYGVNYVCLRFANVYGPDSNDKSSVVAQMCRDALREGVITVYGDGSQRRDFVYIDDVVEAIHLSLTDDEYRGLYSVGTGVMVSILELAKYIQELTGCKIAYRESPRGVETTPSIPDTRFIRCTIDWQAGVNKTLEWYRGQI